MVLAFLKKLGCTPCKGEQPLQGMELQGKKSTKRLKHTGNLFCLRLSLIRCVHFDKFEVKTGPPF